MISEKQSDLIYRPDKWTANTEIDFGGGLYGQRFTGTTTANANQESWKNLVSSGVNRIIESGGSWDKGTSDFIPVNNTFYGTAADSTLYKSDIGKIILYTKSADARSASPYDIWVKYTKTT